MSTLTGRYGVVLLGLVSLLSFIEASVTFQSELTNEVRQNRKDLGQTVYNYGFVFLNCAYSSAKGKTKSRGE